MRAAVFHEPRRVEAGDRPDASLREPTDAVVRVPGSGHSDETLASLPAISDVLSTGHHAAVCADVRPGGTSRHPDRQAVATECGATDIADAYAAMDERRAIKSLVRVGTV